MLDILRVLVSSDSFAYIGKSVACVCVLILHLGSSGEEQMMKATNKLNLVCGGQELIMLMMISSL